MCHLLLVYGKDSSPAGFSRASRKALRCIPAGAPRQNKARSVPFFLVRKTSPARWFLLFPTRPAALGSCGGRVYIRRAM